MVSKLLKNYKNRRNELLIHATMWMNLKSITKEAQKTRCCMIPCMASGKTQTCRDVFHTELPGLGPGGKD